MTNASAQRPSWLRPKYFIFGYVGLMFAYVLWHNESFLIRPDDPIWEHYRAIQWSLLPHAIAAACALILGPMQFSDRLRKRFTKLHRVAGRVYVVAVCVGAPLGVYTQYVDERLGSSRGFTIATTVDATLWMTTTLVGFLFATRGMIQIHRQWMTRSFAVAIVFLEVRVIAGLTGWDQLPLPQSDRIFEILVWSCVGLALLFADIINQWNDLRRRRPAVLPKAQAAAAD